MPSLKSLYRYPIKGLSAQPVSAVELVAAQPFPFDRVFALARPGSRIDSADPKWAKKGQFVMLMLDEALAQVRTHLDPGTLRLTVKQGDKLVLEANLDKEGDRASVEDFFCCLVSKLPVSPKLVRARGDGHFMDKPGAVISLLNLATIRSLEERWGVDINPLRFRANLYIDGASPWEEFEWIGQDIQIGEAVLRVEARNGRCGATNVNPITGDRDLDIPGSLRASFGHKDLGVYLKVRKGGTVTAGDTVRTQMAALERPRTIAKPEEEASGRSYICGGCYFIYDEERGLPEPGSPSAVPFENLATSWGCPDCGAGKTVFRPYVRTR